MTDLAKPVKHRPAETGAGGLAVAVIVARVFTKNPDILAAVGAAAGFTPGAITWFVTLIRRK